MEPPKPDFNSPEDLRALLRYISRRLHYVTRVSGESYYLSALAETARALGELAVQYEDPAVKRRFGNGYNPGEIDRDARADEILRMLREHMLI